MTNITWHAMNDTSIVKEIGQQLKRLRLQKNITQEEMAKKTGLSRSTIVEMEKGRPASLLTFIQLLRGLDELELLDMLKPVPTGEATPAVTKIRRRASSRYPVSS